MPAASGRAGDRGRRRPAHPHADDRQPRRAHAVTRCRHRRRPRRPRPRRRPPPPRRGWGERAPVGGGSVTVYLVGAGPGDPDLLTVKGADVLRRADVVVYDRLSVSSLLDLAPPDAERLS